MLCHIIRLVLLVLIVMFSIPDSAWASVGKVPEQPVLLACKGRTRGCTRSGGVCRQLRSAASFYHLPLNFAFAGGKRVCGKAMHFVRCNKKYMAGLGKWEVGTHPGAWFCTLPLP
jgi:hypothetical protein